MNIHIISKIIFFQTILFILTINIIIAQSNKVVIEGFVHDFKSGENISDASISINDSIVAITDFNGHFKFLYLAGSYIIAVKHIGYKATYKKITTKETFKNNNIFYELKRKPIAISKITINGEKYTENIKYKTYELKTGDIKHIPQLGEPDIIRALHSLPGITSMNDFTNKMFVRGGNFDETLIMLDDVPVYNQNHLGGVFSMFNPSIISSGKLYPSNYPVSYGGYLSGVLNIKTKSGNREKLKGNASIGLISSNIFIELPISKGTLIVSARRTYLDLIASLIGQTLPYYFYDVFMKYTLPFDNNNLIKISFLNSNDTFRAFNNKEYKDKNGTDEPSWGNTIFNIKFTHLFSKGFSAESNIYFTRSGAIANLSSVFNNNPTILFINNSINDYALQLKLNLQLTGQKIKAGYEFKKLRLKYNWKIGKSELSEFGFKLEDSFYDFAENPFNYFAKTFVSSIYLNDQIQLSKYISSTFGLRGTYLHKLKKILLSPSTKVVYKPIKDFEINFSYRKYFQYLYTIKDQSNVILDPYSVYFLQESQNDIAESNNLSIGFNIYNIYKNFNLEIEGFYKNKKNLASSYNNILTRYKFENGFAAGMDILIKKEKGNFFGWVGYSYLRSLKNNGNYLYFTRFDRTHSIKIVLNYTLSEHWHFTSFWTYGTGIPYTPRVGKFIGTNSYPNVFQWYNIQGHKNSVRTDDYHRLDIGFSGSFIWKSLFVKPYIQILNVYNSPNPIYEGKGNNVNTSQTKRATFIIPTIGVTIEF